MPWAQLTAQAATGQPGRQSFRNVDNDGNLDTVEGQFEDWDEDETEEKFEEVDRAPVLENVPEIAPVLIEKKVEEVDMAQAINPMGRDNEMAPVQCQVINPHMFQGSHGKAIPITARQSCYETCIGPHKFTICM